MTNYQDLIKMAYRSNGKSIRCDLVSVSLWGPLIDANTSKYGGPHRWKHLLNHT